MACIIVSMPDTVSEVANYSICNYVVKIMNLTGRMAAARARTPVAKVLKADLKNIPFQSSKLDACPQDRKEERERKKKKGGSGERERGRERRVEKGR